MEPIEKNNQPDPQRYRCSLLNTKQTYYAWQVTGAAWVLLRAYGTIRLARIHLEEVENGDDILEAIKELRTMGTSGGIVADQTSLGKTIMTL
jgi:hypothetical protein